MTIDWTRKDIEHCGNTFAARGWIVLGDAKGLRVSAQEPVTTQPLSMQLIMGLTSTWVRAGMPTLHPTPACVGRMIEALPERRPAMPWPTWLITLPAGQQQIVYLTEQGVPDPARFILCSGVCRSSLTYIVLAGDCEYVGLQVSLEELRDGQHGINETVLGAQALRIFDEDRVARERTGRLILNSILALDACDGSTERVGAERSAELRGRYPAGDYQLRLAP